MIDEDRRQVRATRCRRAWVRGVLAVRAVCAVCAVCAVFSWRPSVSLRPRSHETFLPHTAQKNMMCLNTFFYDTAWAMASSEREELDAQIHMLFCCMMGNVWSEEVFMRRL